MELRSLRHLVALAARMNYSRAAEDVGLSQSALTRSIQALERHAGMRIFDRDRGGVALTAQGETIVERAKILLADADDFDRQLRQTAVGEEGRVRFGMGPLPAWTLLPTTLSDSILKAPGLAHEIVVRQVEVLLPLLMGGEIEFFVSAEVQIPAPPTMRTELIGTFPSSLIVRSGHPLLTGEDAKGPFPVVRSSRSVPPHELPADLHGLAFGPVNIIEDYGSLIALTRSTDSIWLSSTYAVADELAAGTLRPLPRADAGQRPQFRLVMYSMNRRTLSPGAVKLLRAFRLRAAELSERVRSLEAHGPDG